MALTEEEKDLIKEWEAKVEKERDSIHSINGWYYNTEKPWTLLHSASGYGNATVVKALLTRGDDINATSPEEYTPLHCATVARHADVFVPLLIQNGADVNINDQWGRTPLHLLVYRGKAETVEVLIKAGADLNAKTVKLAGVYPVGSTPLHVASHWGKAEAAELLIKAGADLNAKTNEDSFYFPAGSTSLHMASSRADVLDCGDYIGVISLLLRNNADKNIKNNAGNTPKDVATTDDARRLLCE